MLTSKPILVVSTFCVAGCIPCSDLLHVDALRLKPIGVEANCTEGSYWVESLGCCFGKADGVAGRIQIVGQVATQSKAGKMKLQPGDYVTEVRYVDRNDGEGRVSRQQNLDGKTKIEQQRRMQGGYIFVFQKFGAEAETEADAEETAVNCLERGLGIDFVGRGLSMTDEEPGPLGWISYVDPHSTAATKFAIGKNDRIVSFTRGKLGLSGIAWDTTPTLIAATTPETRAEFFAEDFLRIVVQPHNNGQHITFQKTEKLRKIKDLTKESVKKIGQGIVSLFSGSTSTHQRPRASGSEQSATNAKSQSATSSVQSATKNVDVLPGWVWAVIGIFGAIVLSLVVYLVYLIARPPRK